MMTRMRVARFSPLRVRLTASIAGAMFALGCADNTVIELRREVATLEDRVRMLEATIASRDAAIDELQQRVIEARAINQKDLELIYFPVKLELASLSGARDFDDQPGLDGVELYLRPIDREGDVVKVAGDIRVELFDLDRTPQQTLIGMCETAAEETGGAWYGQFWTAHYTLRCPWTSPPGGDTLLVRVQFVDHLTQRVVELVEAIDISQAS